MWGGGAVIKKWQYRPVQNDLGEGGSSTNEKNYSTNQQKKTILKFDNSYSHCQSRHPTRNMKNIPEMHLWKNIPGARMSYSHNTRPVFLGSNSRTEKKLIFDLYKVRPPCNMKIIFWKHSNVSNSNVFETYCS